MDDLSQRIANLSPAKRKLLLKQLEKQQEGNNQTGNETVGTGQANGAGQAQDAVPTGVVPVRSSRPAIRQVFLQRTGMTVDKLKAEAVLDPTITPENVPVGPVTEPTSILLTGSTGFVGAFLLAELLKQTEADIYCLVRAANDEEGKKRIQKNLASYLLWDESQSARIIPILGDLSKPLLGLSDSSDGSSHSFGWLADHIDVIYHNGALVKWTYPYSVLKATNVRGTLEILRLACKAKVKPVHFISTIGVFSSPMFDPDIVYEDDLLEDSQELFVGYAQTKWVAEKLVRTAGSRGLPISIYRPGTGGDSRTGVFNVRDHVPLMIKGCIQLGYIPDRDMELEIAPIDYAARAIIYLSQQQESIGETFHLVNPYPTVWSKLGDWMRDFGYSLQQIPYEEWKRKLLDQGKTSSDNALYAFSSFFSEALMENSKLPHFDCQKTVDALAGTEIACPPIDSQLLETYFSYFLKSGFLEAPRGAKVGRI